MDAQHVAYLKETFEGRWVGRTAFILASGPGLTEVICERVAKVPDVCAIAVNDAYKRAPWAPILYSSDSRFWTRVEGAQDFCGMKVAAHPDAKKICKPGWNVISFPAEHATTMSFTFPLLHYGYNSGFAAMNLALLMGSQKLVLCGFNMGLSPDGTTHFFGVRTDGVKSSYSEFIKAYEEAAPGLAERGIEVVNATPGTHLTCFPVVGIEEAIERLC